MRSPAPASTAKEPRPGAAFAPIHGAASTTPPSEGRPHRAAPIMHSFEIRALRPADDTPEAIEAALAAGRAKLAEAEALVVRLGAELPHMELNDAPADDIAGAERSLADAEAFIAKARRLLPALEARAEAARKKARLDGFAAARQVLEAADAEAARAWQRDYPRAAAIIRGLLAGLVDAQAKERDYRRQVEAAIAAGLITAADLPDPELATRALFGNDRVADMVQLPSPEGLLRDEAIWRPAEILRDTWRQQRATREAAEAEALARVEREREAQATLDAALATMTAHERKFAGMGSAVMPARR